MGKQIFSIACGSRIPFKILPPKVFMIFLQIRGEHVLRDHIALRTFNDPRMNIDVAANALHWVYCCQCR